MTKIPIVEVYGPTIQGEGKYAGQRVGFIRTTGCNLRCKWGDNFCDTPFSSWSPEGGPKEISDILKMLESMQVKSIVLTGGEPYIHRGITELVGRLKEGKYHVTIETNGTIYLPTKADFLSISPKLKSSTPFGTQFEDMHERGRISLDAMSKMMAGHDYQFKFVVSQPQDLYEIQALEDMLSIPKDKIWLMPEGISKTDLEKTALPTAEMALAHGYNYTDRLHVRLWDKKRGV